VKLCDILESLSLERDFHLLKQEEVKGDKKEVSLLLVLMLQVLVNKVYFVSFRHSADKTQIL
jgi:hypothetical protein